MAMKNPQLHPPTTATTLPSALVALALTLLISSSRLHLVEGTSTAQSRNVTTTVTPTPSQIPSLSTEPEPSQNQNVTLPPSQSSRPSSPATPSAEEPIQLQNVISSQIPNLIPGPSQFQNVTPSQNSSSLSRREPTKSRNVTQNQNQSSNNTLSLSEEPSPPQNVSNVTVNSSRSSIPSQLQNVTVKPGQSSSLNQEPTQPQNITVTPSLKSEPSQPQNMTLTQSPSPSSRTKSSLTNNLLGSDHKCSGDQLLQEERDAVAKLKPLVENILSKDYMKRDEYLVRFLRVRNYDVQSAKIMIENAMAWRIQHKIDNILLEEDLRVIENEFPVFLGKDNCGRPTMIGSISVADFRRVALSGRLEKFVRLLATSMELAEGMLYETYLEANATGLVTNVNKALVVLDMNGFNLRQHACVQCLQIIPRVFSHYENFYPDLMYRFYIINTPRIFLPIIDLIRPFLSRPTQKAVQLFDHRAEVWKKALLDDIPADQLQKVYGGNRTNAAPVALPKLRRSHDQIRKVYERELGAAAATAAAVKKP